MAEALNNAYSTTFIRPSFTHASRVFPSHVFNSVVFVADQLKRGQQKCVMQMKMVA